MRPTAVRSSLLLVAPVLLVGCSSSSIGTDERREEPAGAVQATNSRGVPRVSVTWTGPETIAVTTWGSSACASRPVRIERRGAHEVEVRVRTTDGRRGCTADAAPTTSEVALPEGVSRSGPLDVVVDDGGTPSARVTLPSAEGGR